MPDIQFDSFSEFLNMGGYAFYVWTAYAFCAVVLAVNLILPLRERTRLMKALKARMQREGVRSGQTEAEE